jgi:hypothetical protein
MNGDDPFAALGLGRDATLADVRSARRRLAFDLHPDRGGDAGAMQALNAAFDACVAHLTGRRPLPNPTTEPSRRTPAPSAPPPRSRRRRYEPRRSRVEYDSPSFTIDLLPVEAFEALLIVAAIIGEVVDDDPPYVLECVLAEPVACWCRLDLVPDAGASTVSLIVAAVGEDGVRPSAEEVRDRWVEELNRLGGQLP